MPGIVFALYIDRGNGGKDVEWVSSSFSKQKPNALLIDNLHKLSILRRPRKKK